MGTHGPTFVPQRQVFSNRKDIETQNEWDTDFYDDAVLEYDNYIGILVDELQNLGLLEDTILILASDHGMEWEYKTRIPLIIRFPNRLHAARIQTNVQNLDIAPTLLDYLGMQIPDWMEGRSLIREIPPIPIIGTKAFEIVRTGEDKWIMNQQALTAPFFQFNLVSAIYCQKWVELNLVDLTTRSGMIGGHTSPCHAGDMPPDEKYLSWIINHLVANGFDTSGLQIP
jgi:arylsulfatase A-like enzyme